MNFTNRLPFAASIPKAPLAALGAVMLLSLPAPAMAETSSAQTKPANPVSATVSALQQASTAGDIKATLQLAEAYQQGTGVAKNSATAFQLYVEAARAGDAKARFHVGQAYHRGEGTDSNQIAAWVWLTLAGKDKSAVQEQALSLRSSVEKSLSEAQKDRARMLAENLDRMLSS